MRAPDPLPGRVCGRICGRAWRTQPPAGPMQALHRARTANRFNPLPRNGPVAPGMQERCMRCGDRRRALPCAALPCLAPLLPPPLLRSSPRQRGSRGNRESRSIWRDPREVPAYAGMTKRGEGDRKGAKRNGRERSGTEGSEADQVGAKGTGRGRSGPEGSEAEQGARGRRQCRNGRRAWQNRECPGCKRNRLKSRPARGPVGLSTFTRAGGLRLRRQDRRGLRRDRPSVVSSGRAVRCGIR